MLAVAFSAAKSCWGKFLAALKRCFSFEILAIAPTLAIALSLPSERNSTEPCLAFKSPNTLTSSPPLP